MQKKPNYESNFVYREFLRQLEASLAVKLEPHPFLAQMVRIPDPYNINLYVKVNTSLKVFWGVNQNKIAVLNQEQKKWLVILVDGRANLGKIENHASKSNAVTSIRNLWKIDCYHYQRGIAELWKTGGNDGGYKVNSNGLEGIPSFASVAELAKDLKKIGGAFQIVQ